MCFKLIIVFNYQLCHKIQLELFKVHRYDVEIGSEFSHLMGSIQFHCRQQEKQNAI